MKSQVLHTVWCNISCEAAGEFWHWSLSGVKGLMHFIGLVSCTAISNAYAVLTDPKKKKMYDQYGHESPQPAAREYGYYDYSRGFEGECGCILLRTRAQFLKAPGFSLSLNDRAQRPVVLFSALLFFLSALSFFQRPVILREPFGFFGISSELFWAWSCRKRPIKAKGGAIFVHHVVILVGHRRHLGFTMNINLCKLVRPVVSQDWQEHWARLALSRISETFMSISDPVTSKSLNGEQLGLVVLCSTF